MLWKCFYLHNLLNFIFLVHLMKSKRQKIKHFISIIFCTFLPRKIKYCFGRTQQCRLTFLQSILTNFLHLFVFCVYVHAHACVLSIMLCYACEGHGATSRSQFFHVLWISKTGCRSSGLVERAFTHRASFLALVLF